MLDLENMLDNLKPYVLYTMSDSDLKKLRSKLYEKARDIGVVIEIREGIKNGKENNI